MPGPFRLFAADSTSPHASEHAPGRPLILQAVTITLITGANEGLGRETARRLLEVGHTVLVGARDADRGRQAADELGAVFLEIDPTSDASVAAAAERVRRDYGLSRKPVQLMDGLRSISTPTSATRREASLD
jgi:hypothetical protein